MSDLSKGRGKIQNSRKSMTPEQLARESENKKKPTLKPSQRKEMEALWESGEVTLKELAQRFNRDEAAISRYMKENGVVKGSKAEEYAQLIKEKIAEELLGDAGENAKRIKKMKEDYINYNEALNRLASNEIASARNKGLPLQSILPNIRTLNELAKLFATTRTENWALMNVIEFEQRIEKDDVPELRISELTSQEIEQMHLEQARLAGLTGDTLEFDMPEIEYTDSDEVVEEGDE